MARFTETIYLESTPDASDGVLRGVKLLGENSRNNRRYGKEVREAAAPMYKGKKVYIDHQRDQGDRSYDRWAGTVIEAYNREDGIYGDVKLRQKSPYFDGILEAVKDFPTDVGFSHVADGECRMEGTTEVVESIKEVFSVDLVTDPATTGGFFESARTKTMSKTVKEILKSADKRNKWAKLLKEMEGEGMVPGDMAVEAPEEADPAEEVKLALEKAAMAVLKKWFSGDIEEAAAISEIKKIAGMKDEAVSEPEGGEVAPAPEPAAESAALKAVQAELAKLKESKALTDARNLLLESNIEPTEARIKTLARTPENEQDDLIESWPTQDNGTPERPERSRPRIQESDEEFPRDPAKFAALLR